MSSSRRLPFRPDNEPVRRWRLGAVTITRVVEGISEFPRRFLPRLTRARIDACGPWSEPYTAADRETFPLSVHAFVIDTPGGVAVVDTCVGLHGDRPMGHDPGFGDRLDAAIPGGFDAVGTVICTHLHFDHVGWNTRVDGDRLVPSFPNARYLCSRAELDATLADDTMRVVDTGIRPLMDAGRLDPVAPDHRISPWLSLIPTPGHTPGHVCVQVGEGDHRAIITGDAAHSPLQFAYPDVSAESVDADSAMATRTRERLVAELADTDTIVFGTHFPTPTAGRLRRLDPSSPRSHHTPGAIPATGPDRPVARFTPVPDDTDRGADG
ncbi:MAG: MBL fold metallo-hydrolase [Acidimicrobiales bacterium]